MEASCNHNSSSRPLSGGQLKLGSRISTARVCHLNRLLSGVTGGWWVGLEVDTGYTANTDSPRLWEIRQAFACLVGFSSPKAGLVYLRFI